MGQRLVVNIKNGDIILANAYYHWSGYSRDSLSTIKPIVNYLIKKEIRGNDIEEAIDLLRLTGADIIQKEFEEIKDRYPNLVKVKEDNRNDGLISVTKEGIEESLYWAEGIINIDLRTKTFDYEVVYLTTKEEYKMDYDEELTEDKLMETDFSLYGIPIYKFNQFYEVIDSLVDEGKYLVSEGKIYCPIY